jgi:hypothetical protein
MKKIEPGLHANNPDLWKAPRANEDGYPQWLAGWSEGDEEIPLPMAPMTEEEKKFLDESNLYKGWKEITPDKMIREFPLRATTVTRNFAERYRREAVINNVWDRLSGSNKALVLVTTEHTVYQAKSFLGLIWVYLKYKFWGKKHGKGKGA